MTKTIMRLAFAVIAIAVAGESLAANETAKMVGYRIKPKSVNDCVTGEWMANFSIVKKYAEDNGLPLFAMWTNGENCSHCTKFEGCVNAKAFREWMAESGIVFWFGYNGDTSADDRNDGTGWNFCYKNQSLYPLIRFYWKAKKGTVLADGTVLTKDTQVINKYTMGDDLDKRLKASEGGTAKVIAALTSAYKQYVPVLPTSYKGGEFALPNLDPDVYNAAGLQAEVGLTTSVSIPMIRTNSTAQTSMWTNKVQVAFTGKPETKEVKWAAGQTEAAVSFTMPGTMKAGDKYQVLLLDADTGEAVGTNYIKVVAAQKNSVSNPYWLGERSAGSKAAPELGWGEWTVDLDLAKKKAKNDGGKTLLLVGGGTWCPDCSATDHFFFENPAFKTWCVDNKVALALVDIPNYNSDTSKSSLLSYDVNDTLYNSRTKAYDSYRFVTYNYSGETNMAIRYQSGAGYLSRHNLKPTDAAVTDMVEKFRKIACDKLADGGYKRPEATNVRMGVPVLLAIREDGSVAGRMTAFSVSGPTSFREGYLTRLSELIAQISDVEEDANDYPTTAGATTAVIDRGTVSGTRSLSSTDREDYYPIDKSAVGPLVKFSVNGVSPDTDDVLITLSLCNNAKSTLETLATVTTNLGAGVELSYVVPNENCFLKVSYPLQGSLPAEGTFFATDKLKSTVCEYTLSTDCVLSPTEDVQKFKVSDGVASVTMAVEEGVTYKLVNVDDTVPGFLDHFQKGASEGLFIALLTESATIPLAHVENDFEYRIWNTGKIGFSVPVASASERDGKYVVEIVRQGGSAGTAKATLRLNAAKTTTLADIYEFDDDGREFSWEDGNTDTKTTTITIKNNAFYDGNQTVALKLEQTSGTSDAGLAGANFELTIREDDTANAGKLVLAGEDPHESKTGVLYARRGSTVKFSVSRSGGTTGTVVGKVSTTAGTLSANEFTWAGREGGSQEFSLTVPDEAKAKLTLSGVGGAKVDSAHRYITVYTVTENAPQFVSETFDFSATRYLQVTGASAAVDPAYLEASGKVSVSKVSGSLPSGVKAAYSEKDNALVFSGIPTKAGSYTATYRVTKGTVKGLTAMVRFTVADPAVPSAPGEPALNPAVATTRTISDALVLDNVTTALVGVATITIPRTGKVSMKVKFVDSDLGTKSFSSSCWSSIDPLDGTLTATVVNKAYAIALGISVAANGDVSISGLDGFGAEFRIKMPGDEGTFTAAKPATDWKGTYTASMPLVNPDKSVLARGSGYLCLNMTTASAVKKGVMKYAGCLPNGKTFSGSATMTPIGWDSTLSTPNWEKAIMPFLMQSTTDGLGGVLEIVRADATGYGRGLRKVVYTAREGDDPLAVTYWIHREAKTDDADYASILAIFGGKYDPGAENWKTFYDEYYKVGSTYPTLSFFADPTVIDFSDDYTKGLAWDITGYGVTLGYTSKKVNTISKQSKYAAAGFTLSFASSTGVVSGSFRAPTEEGGYATMTYKAIVLPGWGASGCDECSPDINPAPERPFVSGAAWVKDSFPYMDGTRARTTKVVKGCEVTIGVEAGK